VKRQSLRSRHLATRTAAVAGGAFALFLAIAVPSLVWHFQALHEETIGQEQSIVATAVADALEGRLALVREGLERAAAGLPTGLLEDSRSAAAFLEARLAMRALCDGGALVIDRGGRLVAAFPPDLRPPGPAQLRPQALGHHAATRR